MISNNKYLFIFICVLFSVSSTASNRSENAGFLSEINKEFPRMHDTYGITTNELEQYLVKIQNRINKYPRKPINYYIKSDLLTTKIGHYYRKNFQVNNYTKNDYQTTNKMLLEAIDVQSALITALNLNEKVSDDQKLSYSVLTEVVGNLKSPFQKERAIKSRIQMTSLKDLEGCPANLPESDPYYECTPIAHSWPEYLYQEYTEMFNLYGLLLDKENMVRINDEFEERVKSNEKNIELTERDKKNNTYYLEKMSTDEKLFWEKYNNGELDGKVINIDDIPAAYKAMPFYWKNYIADKGLAEHAQWDIRGLDSPDNIKTKQASSSNHQAPITQSQPAKLSKPVTPEAELVPEVTDNRLWYLALGVLILLVAVGVLVRKRRQ